MAHKRKSDQTKLIAEAALQLADTGGWDGLTFGKIARKARLRESDIEKRFSDIWDILKYALTQVEERTQKEVEGYLGDDWRDNLMEILMTRLDIAQKHRGAYLSLLPAARKNPQIVARFAPSFYQTMKSMLALAKAPGLMQPPPAIGGFGLVYLSLVHAWAQDDTEDLSKTMAVIDKRLEMLEKLASLIPCPKVSKAAGG